MVRYATMSWYGKTSHFMKPILSQNRFLFLSLSIFTIFSSFPAKVKGQNPPKLRDPNNQLLKEKAVEMDIAGGVIYWCEGALKVGELFTIYKQFTGMNDDAS